VNILRNQPRINPSTPPKEVAVETKTADQPKTRWIQLTFCMVAVFMGIFVGSSVLAPHLEPHGDSVGGGLGGACGLIFGVLVLTISRRRLRRVRT